MPDAPYIERAARTVLTHQKEAARLRERIAAARATIEPLAAKQKLAAAELKKGQAAFEKKHKDARAAQAKLNQLLAKPGATGIDAAREALRAQFADVAQHGAALATDASALETLQTQMVAPAAEADAAKASIKLALKSMKDEKTEIDLAFARLGKLTAASKIPSAAAELAQSKAVVAEVAAAIKAVQAFELAAGREAHALRTLSGLTPAGASARAQAGAAAKRIAQAQVAAKSSADELQRAIDAEASKHRSDAPSARRSQCDLERFDFMSFSFPAAYDVKGAPDVYKNGKLVRSNDTDIAPDESYNTITSVKTFDLDGDGKKEAVVFIEGPPSAHSGPSNELHFMQLDDQCRVQQFAVITGGVYEGAMKGKYYVYADTLFETPEGQSGSYAAGTESVTVLYVNNSLKEISRKPDPH